MISSSEPKPRGLIKDFIWVKENSLTESFCNHVIKKFDKDPRKHDGCVGSKEHNRVDKSVKDTKDYNITRAKDWKEEDDTFFNALSIGIQGYTDYLYEINTNCAPNPNFKQHDTGFKVQKYEAGGHYKWHHDWSMSYEPVASRIFTFMWYLNTIKEEDEGYTEFADGTKIQPKCGSLVLFPATWTYLHRGYPPKVEKYVCNGWIHARP